MFANAGSHEFAIDIDPILPAIQKADLVSVTIVNYCRQFLPLLRTLGKSVSVDIHDYDGINPHHQDFIEAANYLFMSSVRMPGWREFLEQRVASGTKIAICTQGSAGASGLTADAGWVDIPAVAEENIVDTNGAGDAFYAGFMISWLAGQGLEAAMHRGAETAAAAVQSPDLASSQ